MTLLDRMSTGPKAWIILFLLTFTAAAPGVFNLPALDRDESRFAQASKQMLEDEDYIRIKYQDELRNKKPAGIHWLQAGATALFTGPEAKQIWTYRVPSWLGAALGTLACFWCGIPLIGRRASFIGAALFGSTLLLTSEAHISKTDGVLVFLTTLSIGALARLYLNHNENRSRTSFGDMLLARDETKGAKRLALLFWLCMGLSFLIKGPVTPMVAAYAGFGAWVWARVSTGKGGHWWRPLIWWPGALIFVALVLPWFLWIQAATDGQYVKGAVGKDLKDKFAGASEGHGGWPLYHLSHIPVWFFPATLLAIPAIMATWTALKGTGQAAAKAGRDGLKLFVIIGVIVGILSYLLPLLVGAVPGLPQSVIDLTRNGLRPAFPAILLAVFWRVSSRPSWRANDAIAEPISDETKALRFLVSWALLTWMFFELMPTLLSHYILPAYPAFGLLCGFAAVKMIDGAGLPKARGVSLVLFGIGTAALLAVSWPGVAVFFMEETAGDFKTVAASSVLESWQPYTSFPMWLWWIGFALAGFAIAEFARRRDGVSIILAVAASVVLGWHVRTFMLPSQIWLQPTETARLALEDVCGVPGTSCLDASTRDGGLVAPPERILALGYAEPSYVLTLGTQNLHPPETPLDLPSEENAYPVVYLINFEDRKAAIAPTEMMAQLRDQAVGMNRCITASEPYYALNYSNGDPVHFRAIRFDAAACGADTP